MFRLLKAKSGFNPVKKRCAGFRRSFATGFQKANHWQMNCLPTGARQLSGKPIKRRAQPKLHATLPRYNHCFSAARRAGGARRRRSGHAWPCGRQGGARKVRRIYHDKVLAGFAGGTADAFSLLDRFEGKLEKYQGHLMRAAVELAKDWRTDRMLRRLEAMLIVANVETTLVLTGNGDVLDPEDGICAIG